MDTSEVIKKWAEAKYGLNDVTEGSFDMENGNEGCPTCGPNPPEMCVFVRFDGGKSYKSFVEYYATDLINEILDYA
jgi:hypothetical protein